MQVCYGNSSRSRNPVRKLVIIGRIFRVSG